MRKSVKSAGRRPASPYRSPGEEARLPTIPEALNLAEQALAAGDPSRARSIFEQILAVAGDELGDRWREAKARQSLARLRDINLSTAYRIGTIVRFHSEGGFLDTRWPATS